MCKLFLYLFFILSCSRISGQIIENRTDKHTIHFSLFTTYQKESYKWSISGNLSGKNPNILSELIWKDLSSTMTEIEAFYVFKRRLIIGVRARFSFIVSGKVTDTDYQEDNRTVPSFDASLGSGKGNGLSLFPVIGYNLIDQKRNTLAGATGYGINHQRLYLIGKAPLYENLYSTYDNKWNGPFVELKENYRISDKLSTFIYLIYNQINYSAKANWNLIDEYKHPVSFTHKAKGYGLETYIRFSYKLTPLLSAFTGAGYFYWSTGKGIDELFFENGNIVKTRLNDVTRKGFYFGIGTSLKL